MKNREIVIEVHSIRFIRKGFTLVELLVVIAIIALLLAILMPSLQKAREQSKAIVCQSNVKQLSLGFMIYLQEYNNKAPATAVSRNDPSYIPWNEQIGPYMGDSKYASNPEKRSQKFMFCPSTFKAKQLSGYSPGLPKYRWRYDLPGRQVEGAYAMNAFVGGGILTDYLLPTWPQYLLSFRPNGPGSADIPVFGDSTWSEAYPFDTDPAPRFDISSNNSAASYGDFWLPTMYRYYINRHNMKINSSFADGHCNPVPLTGLWNLKWHKDFNKVSYVPIPKKK
jgi:prepilin-type N-terminal cleavage/methylation domain-containing protein